MIGPNLVPIYRFLELLTQSQDIFPIQTFLSTQSHILERRVFSICSLFSIFIVENFNCYSQQYQCIQNNQNSSNKELFLTLNITCHRLKEKTSACYLQVISGDSFMNHFQKMQTKREIIPGGTC